LDCSINPTAASEGKPSAKRLCNNSVREVNLTTKGTSKQNKQAKTKSNSNGVLVKSKELVGNKPLASSTLKCKVYNRNHATKDYYYTLKNSPS
jgi:hypothetical protein